AGGSIWHGPEDGEYAESDRGAANGEKRADAMPEQVLHDVGEEADHALTLPATGGVVTSPSWPFSKRNCRLAVAAACGSCVTRISVVPSSALSRRSRSRSCSVVSASRSPVGSSATTTTRWA